MKNNYPIGTLAEADKAKRKKFHTHAWATLIWVLLISNVLSWGYTIRLSAQLGDSPLAGRHRASSLSDFFDDYGVELPWSTTTNESGLMGMVIEVEDWDKYILYLDSHPQTTVHDEYGWVGEIIEEEDWRKYQDYMTQVVHSNSHPVQDDPTITEPDPELYWITHYGPPTFAPTDPTAWGMSLEDSLGWAEDLAMEWGVIINGICAAHKHTPWYEKNIYPPVLLKIEGRGNYLVLDRKGEGDSVGVDIYEPDQDGPMYNYKGEVTEIVGWWCE